MKQAIGTKCYLRAVDLKDAELSKYWRNDFYVTERTMGFRYPVSGIAESEWLAMICRGEDKSRVMMTICDLENNPVGFALLNEVDLLNRNGRIGILLGESSARGKGIGFEAMRLICAWGFDRLNLKRVYGFMNAANADSIGILTKLGFVEEGCMRQHYCLAQRYYDVTVVGLLESEFVRDGIRLATLPE